MLLILIFKYDQNHEGEYPEIKSGGTSLYAIAPQSLGFGFEKAKARKSDVCIIATFMRETSLIFNFCGKMLW
ncbi:hypothetical protein ACFX2I_024557 [Malus domestica]